MSVWLNSIWAMAAMGSFIGHGIRPLGSSRLSSFCRVLRCIQMRLIAKLILRSGAWELGTGTDLKTWLWSKNGELSGLSTLFFWHLQTTKSKFHAKFGTTKSSHCMAGLSPRLDSSLTLRYIKQAYRFWDSLKSCIRLGMYMQIWSQTIFWLARIKSPPIRQIELGWSTTAYAVGTSAMVFI